MRDPEWIADAAVAALRAEAELTPKPGLVDRRGSGAHADMDLATLLASAEALRATFEECAVAGRELPPGLGLRARLGAVGRAGESRMADVTGGVNTHRGAIWALGLLAAGVAADVTHGPTWFAARLARLPDVGLPQQAHRSHGALARARYGVAGATGEACAGFPHVTTIALPVLRRGVGETARLDALIAVMAVLPDTCLLHRGGAAGLAAVQRAAGDVLAAGGCGTPEGRRRLDRLDRITARRGLSPGGSADLLAAALFLDTFEPGRTPMQTLNFRFPADRVPDRRAHVGVVASGDLEVLLDRPGSDDHAEVRVRTSIDGTADLWHAVLTRFFADTPLLGRWEINDSGATPGVVALRLRQVADAAVSG